jgi:hypothetical protein
MEALLGFHIGFWDYVTFAALFFIGVVFIGVLIFMLGLPGRIAFSSAQGFQLRTDPLVPEEPVVSLAYPDGHLRVAGGRFVQYGEGERFAGTALLEVYDGDDRLVLDHGASGAPIFDCAGRVVAVASNLLTTSIQFGSHAVRISTAWGTPNVVSVPAPVLKDFAHAPVALPPARTRLSTKPAGEQRSSGPDYRTD